MFVIAGLAAAAVAGAAEAATIRACVKPTSGATRIVGAKAKCRHGERKLSWSTTGPQGKAGPGGPGGPPGAPGATGASGIGPAFTALGSEIALSEPLSVMIEKTIPPGSYVFSAPVILTVSATTAGKSSTILCFAVDKPGTSLVSSDLVGKTVEFTADGDWVGPLAESSPTSFAAATTMTLAGAFESKVTSTMGVACSATGAGTTAGAPIAEIVATQVSSISS